MENLDSIEDGLEKKDVVPKDPYDIDMLINRIKKIKEAEQREEVSLEQDFDSLKQTLICMQMEREVLLQEFDILSFGLEGAENLKAIELKEYPVPDWENTMDFTEDDIDYVKTEIGILQEELDALKDSINELASQSQKMVV